MGFYRRLALVLIVLVVALGVYHSVTSYPWVGTLNTPKGHKAETVTYTCGPPWGSSYVHRPAVMDYPVEGTPCAQRSEYRLMAVVDVVIGFLAFGFVAGWHRRLRAQPSLT